MKKTFLLLVALMLAAMVSHAQTEKGNQTLGLDFGVNFGKSSNATLNPATNSYDNSNSKNSGFQIGPSYSYFIADKLDLGGSLSYSTNSDTYSNAPDGSLSKSSSNTYEAGIYLRKYFMFSDKIGLRTGPYAFYEKSNSKLNYADEPTFDQNANENSFDAGIRLEFVYYPSKNLGFSASLANLAYDHSKTTIDERGNSSSDNFGLNLVNNDLSFSIFYTFGK